MGPSKRSAGPKDDIAANAAPPHGTPLPNAFLPAAPLPNAPVPATPLPAAPPMAPRPRATSTQRVYSPGGCGCALLMAPVVAAGIGLAALSLGLAFLALIALIAAIVLTVREIKRTRSGAGARGLCHRGNCLVRAEPAVSGALYLVLVRRLKAPRGASAPLT